MLTEAQLELISTQIEKSSITVQEVKDDLVDHFCCSIENHMQEGLSFEAAYQKTFAQVCPAGLNQIQTELILLLNFNRIIHMSKLKYSIGCVASSSISTGFLFKVMHWPGADYLLTCGLTSFILLFLPLLANGKYQANEKRKADKLLYILGFVSMITFGIGIVGKIAHLTSSGFLVVGGTLLFTFGFLPVLFVSLHRNALKRHLQ